MKKATLATVAFGAAAVTALSLSACGSSSNTPSSSAPASSAAAGLSGTVTLKVSGGSTEQAWLKQEETAWAATQPNLKVTWSTVDIEEGSTGSTISKDPSTAPNVYLFSNDQIGVLNKANAIGSFVGTNASTISGENSKLMVDSVTLNGTVYGAPVTSNTWFMYYNPSIITDPTDLDAMLTEAKAKNAVVAFPLGNSWYTPAFYFGAGATIYGGGGSATTAPAGFDTPAAVAVTNYLVGLTQNPAFYPDYAGKDVANLATGSSPQFAAAFSGSWDLSSVKKALGSNFKAAPVPSFTAGGTKYQMKAFAGSKAAAWNPAATNAQSNTTVQQASALFAMWLGGKQAQLDAFNSSALGYIPTNTALANDASVLASPIAKATMDTINNASVIQPGWTGMGTVWFGSGVSWGTNATGANGASNGFLGQLATGKITAATAQSATDTLAKNLSTMGSSKVEG